MRRGIRRAARKVVGIVLVAAGFYLAFAAGVMLVLALTDISGFVTNPASVALFFALLVSGLAVGFTGTRALDLRRRARR